VSSLIDNDGVTADILERLERIAEPIATKGRVPPAERDATIIQLCQIAPLSANQIAILIGRDIRYMRQQILPELIEQGLITYLYPETPNHPGQRYLARHRGNENDAG
jgi:hypothetical protein